MINLIKTLPKYEKGDFAAARFYCNFAAYGEYEKIALFWAQTNEKNETTALICLIDGNMTISENGADRLELKEFIGAIGPKTVLCEKALADELKLNPSKICTVLCAVPPHDISGAAENTNEGINRLYEILRDDFSLEKEAFSADISHRVRHNCAFYVTSPFSAAVCVYSEDLAIINGICVDKEKRGKGLGSATLSRIKSGARNKIIFAATENAEDFYIKNNFSVCEKVAYCFGDTL